MEKDTFSYKGWLISDKFYRRALANLGYHLVGLLFVYIAIFAVMLLILMIGGIFSVFRLLIG